MRVFWIRMHIATALWAVTISVFANSKINGDVLSGTGLIIITIIAMTALILTSLSFMPKIKEVENND